MSPFAPNIGKQGRGSTKTGLGKTRRKEKSILSASHRKALLIVDHGTRSESANQRFADFTDGVARKRPDWIVTHAHMELSEPSFAVGIDALAQQGVKEILVHLHFLGHGYHIRETIPELLEEARTRHPQICITTTQPLGDDPRLVDIVLDRMQDHEQLSENAGEAAS